MLANDSDPDANDILTVTGVAGGNAGGLAADHVGTSVAGTYGTLTIDATGNWLYTLDNADGDTDGLAQGQPASDIFTYTISDGHGGIATSTLTINIGGTNDAPALQNPVPGDVVLADDRLTAHAMMAFGDIDLTDWHRVEVAPLGTGNGYVGSLTGSVAGTDATGTGMGSVQLTYALTRDEYMSVAQPLERQDYLVTLHDNHGATRLSRRDHPAERTVERERR